MKSVEFGSLFKLIRNGMNVRQDKSGQGLPITRIETIAEATIDETRLGYADLKQAHCGDWLLKDGDILFSHINSVEQIGKCAVYRGKPENLVHGMNLLCLRCDTSKLLPEFAKHLIRSPSFRQQLAKFINKAVNQASLSIGNLKTIHVQIPTLDKQRRIAEILGRAEALLAKRRTVLGQLERLERSIFLDLFGDPAGESRGPPMDVLEDCCSFFSGFAWKADRFSKDAIGLPIIRIQNVDSYNTEFAYWPDSYDGRFVVRSGDLLLTLSGSFRIGEWSGPDSLLNQRIVRIDPKEGTERLWLLHAIRLLCARIEALGRHALVNNVALADLKRLSIVRPPPESQREFSRRAARVAALRVAQFTSLRELNALFASLQHRAFGGEL